MKCHGSFATYNIMGTVYNQRWKGMISILYNQRRLPMTKQCFRCNDIYQMVVDHGFVDPTFQSRDFRSGAPRFGELIMEYRACSMATLMLSRALPSLAIMTSHSQIMPSRCANSPRHAHRPAALGTGDKCHLTSHWLWVLVNLTSFNVLW